MNLADITHIASLVLAAITGYLAVRLHTTRRHLATVSQERDGLADLNDQQYRQLNGVAPDEATAANFATAVATVVDELAPLREAVAGYKTQLERDGHSPSAAEVMSVQLHQMLVMAIVNGQKGAAR